MEQILLSLIQGNIGRAPVKKTSESFFTLLGIFFVLAGAGFFMAAGYGWLQKHFDLQTATLFMGGAVLIAAAVCASVAYAISQMAKVKAYFYYRELMNNVRSAVEAVTSELEEPIHENPKTATLLAGLAGYAAGQKFLH